MKYSIGDFSKLTNLGVHTLRYYEHEHLITPKRNSSNRRCYTDKDLAWINFIKRLKNTGMSIKEIQHYAELRANGESTLFERMEMLISHKNTINKQINQLQENIKKLDEKIKIYQQEINGITRC
ncbi:MerR family transcriptional regulator [Escherichia coli]|uniref:MerR family transcriptional regulator n=1 Tax=Escherichia coli TaxID=562 RepID=UPI0013232397|nr:MerR family transcriptional regulator [Escherichia coli]EBB6053197.1 MerR family transcriptional regulator [Salmonella enterica]EEY8759866.1 MerR family transcriptional regulator [Escherichia coli]EFA5495519.1 MerR family transcriptional regulator [Escherichia coli]EFA5505679.1 MerR family transcriptional regulator [Escherichia coli]EFB5518851.1 MerR family transcriptional regulator [Escherichia coli]